MEKIERKKSESPMQVSFSVTEIVYIYVNFLGRGKTTQKMAKFIFRSGLAHKHSHSAVSQTTLCEKCQ